MEARFLEEGGDPIWLENVQKAPKKIQDLLHLNRLLAHQPWLLTEQHIAVRFGSLPSYYSLGFLVQSSRTCVKEGSSISSVTRGFACLHLRTHHCCSRDAFAAKNSKISTALLSRLLDGVLATFELRDE